MAAPRSQGAVRLRVGAVYLRHHPIPERGDGGLVFPVAQADQAIRLGVAHLHAERRDQPAGTQVVDQEEGLTERDAGALARGVIGVTGTFEPQSRLRVDARHPRLRQPLLPALHLRLAIAMAGRVLADLGATVLATQVDDDPLANLHPRTEGAGLTAAFLDGGKHAIDAGAVAPGDPRLAVAIVAEGDAAIAALRAAGVAVVELATWPRDADPALLAAPASEFTIMAVGGLLDMVGAPGRAPLRLAGHQVAYAAGLAAFTAASAAMAHRDAVGAPLDARVSLLETAVWMNWKAVVGAAAGPSPPTRRGDDAEFPVLRCADGWVALVYTHTQFDRVRTMIGDALDEPRFADRAWRATNPRAFADQVRPWFAARTREQAYAAARRAGVPLGPIYTPGELLADEQYLARGVFDRVGEPGRPAFPRLPATWNGRRVGASVRTVAVPT